MLAAVEAGVPIVEYTPAEVKQSVVGYGRAEKGQVQSMIQLLLGLAEPPTPFDASDALAIAVCHLHKMNLRGVAAAPPDAPKAASRATELARVPPSPLSMIAHLRGRLLEKHPNRVIVDVQGVGYDVHVPLSTFYEMAEPGGEIALRIHTHVREDALLLYGFATLLELQIFERLISVSGIGPKLALAVLSGIEPNELVVGDSHGERRAAHRHSGHRQEDGRAHRARAEGQDGGVRCRRKRRPSPTAAASETLRTDVLSALMNLGYHRPLAERAVDAALKKSARLRFETVLKHALRELAR